MFRMEAGVRRRRGSQSTPPSSLAHPPCWVRERLCLSLGQEIHAFRPTDSRGETRNKRRSRARNDTAGEGCVGVAPEMHKQDGRINTTRPPHSRQTGLLNFFFPPSRLVGPSSSFGTRQNIHRARWSQQGMLVDNKERESSRQARSKARPSQDSSLISLTAFLRRSLCPSF